MQADRSVRVGNLHKLPDWSNNLVCPRLSWHMFRKELTTDELIRWAGTLLPRVACIWRSSGRPKRHSMTCVRNLIGPITCTQRSRLVGAENPCPEWIKARLSTQP